MRTFTHGTYYSYRKQKCRCDLCKIAARKHGNGIRDEAGVTATLRNLATGATEALHVPGLAYEATRIVCAHCDNLGDTWRIQSLSTPRSILRDLKGDRSFDRNGKVTQNPPELLILAQVHRLDLLAPELAASSSEPRKYGRRAKTRAIAPGERRIS
jgi:hypothetical protein